MSRAASTSKTTNIGGPLTAFGDLRNAEITPIFQGSFEYTVLNILMNTNTVTNTGTVTQATAMAVVGSGTTTASTAELKSVHCAKYRAGEGGLTRFTALFTAGVANTKQYVGITDERGASATYKNGYTIGYTGVTFQIQRWQNDVLVETVAQSAFDDPLNGLGTSGILLDQTKLNVYQIEYQYLGAGAIAFSVENNLTGRLEVFHTIKYSNLNTTPSTYNPNYKFSIFVDNGSTTSNIVAKSCSYVYFTEGKTKEMEIHQSSFSTGYIEKTSVTTEKAILTLKNKTTFPTSLAKTNFITIILKELAGTIDNTGTTNVAKLRLVLNATLGGSPSYTDINAASSCCSVDTAGTTVTGGVTVHTLSLTGKNDGKESDLSGFDVYLAPGETITVAALSDASATIDAALLRKELL